jgi:hypothetical protein
VSRLPSRARPGTGHGGGDRVVEHGAVDDVGQPSCQGAHGFHGGLPVGFAAVEVGTSLGWVAQLDGGHDVDGPVDLPVAGPRQPVPDLVAG